MAVDTLGGEQEMTVISEPGMFAAILGLTNPSMSVNTLDEADLSTTEVSLVRSAPRDDVGTTDPIGSMGSDADRADREARQAGRAAHRTADALEMVRRAERGIGVAIRNGQEVGEIRRWHETARRPGRVDDLRDPDIINMVTSRRWARSAGRAGARWCRCWAATPNARSNSREVWRSCRCLAAEPIAVP